MSENKEEQSLAIRVKDVTKVYRLYEKPIDRLKETVSITHKNYYPMQLIDFANKQKKKIGFHKKWDKMIVVFDADIFEKKVTNFQEVVALGEKENILAISNPSFELFLLLHFKDAYEKDILPNMDAIIKNEKVGNHTFIYHLLWKRTGKNSKKNPEIGELATQIGIEIEQERKINQDIHDCQGKITCNIGKIIEMIRGDAANKL